MKCRLIFQGADGTLVPAFVSSNLLNQPDGMSICMVAMDLTELENSTHLIQELRMQKEALRQSTARQQLLSSCASRLLSSDNPQSIINDLCREVTTHLD